MKTTTGASLRNFTEEPEYESFLSHFSASFLNALSAGDNLLFTTDACGDHKLFEAYLSRFLSKTERQHNNCSACRQFINHYAGLVTIDEYGVTKPAMLLIQDDTYGPSLNAVRKLVARAKVTGIFLSSVQTLGTPRTLPWRHLSATLPRDLLHVRYDLTARQMMAERREDYKNVVRALGEFSQATVYKACELLDSEQLYRSEKVLGAARWLHDLHAARNGVADMKAKANVTWRAVAKAPAGYCHPRTSMIGTLLEDIQSEEMDFDDIAKRFAAKMHPLQYQRPQAAPKAGTIANAEKLVEKLGIERSLQRRFCTLDEVRSIWIPSVERKLREATLKSGGVFTHIKPKGTKREHALDKIKVPPIVMTWEKFLEKVLPVADKIEYRLKSIKDHFVTLVTAVHADAPPILQWDSEEARNPISWYVWQGGSTAREYQLTSGTWEPVSAVTYKPSMWNGASSHHGESVIFVLEGAQETRSAGGALFPEILKTELHGVRSVIEAYSKDAVIAGINEPMACGIMLSKGIGEWANTLRVTVGTRSQEYRLDRWE